VVDSEPVFAAGAVSILAAAGFDTVTLDLPVRVPEVGAWVTRVPALRARVVVVDSGLGVRPYGTDVAAALAAAAPDVAVVMLVRRAQSVGMVEAMESGTLALVHRRCSPEELVAAVSAALGGQNWVAAPLAGLLRGELLSEVSGEHPPELSRRELEVLRGLATGATNAQIAQRLAISEHTVRNHVHSVMRKLGVATRTDAVATGLRRGLVDLPE
jgi:two-component system response regulator DegU